MLRRTGSDTEQPHLRSVEESDVSFRSCSGSEKSVPPSSKSERTSRVAVRDASPACWVHGAEGQ